MPDEPVLTQTAEGATVSYRGRLLYSPDTPRTSAARRARTIPAEERTLYFVPSLGLGYGLDALLERCPPSSHILCVEVDQTLMALGSRGAGGPLPRDGRLTVVRTDDPRVVAALLVRKGAGAFRRCRLVNLSGGYHLDRPVYDAMFAALERQIAEHWQNRMTSIHLGSLWVKNLLANLPRLGDALPLAAMRGPGPVVVAGAGPSLERALPALRDLRGRARLVAVDTALPVLACSGVRPDVVFVLEAQQANLYDFLPRPDPATPLIADLTAHPESVRLFRGPLAFVLSSFADLGLLRRLEESGLSPHRLPALGSVGVAACAVALELTDAEVWTCGLDFAFEGDKTHARGAPFHTFALLRSNRLAPALTATFAAIRRRPLQHRSPGGQPTDSVLASYAATLDALAAASERIAPLGPALPSVGDADRRAEAPPRQDAPDTAPPAAARIAEFLQTEIELSRQAEAVAARLLRLGTGGRAATPTDADLDALRAVDYAAAHFPESAGGEIVPTSPSLPYLARLRHAILVYGTRIARIADREREDAASTAPRA
jgi:hypothetical protein